MSDTKTCPYCAEEIKAAAIKCRYCQSDLTAPTRRAGATAAPRPVESAQLPAPDPVESAQLPASDPVESAQLPAPEPAQPRTGPAWTARWADPRLVAVLSVLALVLAAGVGYLAFDLSRFSGADRARTAGAAAAETDVEKILSYSYGSFDKGTAEAQRLMTPTFEKEYADTVKLVRQDALATKSTVKAQVVARSVVDATPDKVQALLFVNQTTTGAKLAQPRVDLNRVLVTLVPDDNGGWLVDHLKAL